MIEREPLQRAPSPVAAPSPGIAAASPHPLLQLQARVGNRATIALLRHHQASGAIVARAVDDGAQPVEPVPNEDGEDDADPLVEDARSAPYRLDGDDETHTAETRFIDGEAVPGINSTWTTVTQIEAALLSTNAKEAGVKGSEVRQLLQPVQAAKRVEGQAHERLLARSTRRDEGRERDQAAEREGKGERTGARDRSQSPASKRGDPSGRGFRGSSSSSRGGGRAESPSARGGGGGGGYEATIASGSGDRATAAMLDARSEHTSALHRLNRAIEEFHREAWYRWSEVLGVTLMPASAVFQDKDTFRGDAGNLDQYHTGTEGDRIPIVWYKAPTDYPTITFPPDQPGDDFEEHAPFTNFDLDGVQFGVTGPNRPRLGWPLKKVAHASDRAEQRRYNDVLIKNEAYINDRPFNQASVDGDHVKDLGFGGVDDEDNYWPLDSTINRRGFHGYNGNYLLNYKTTVKGNVVGRTRAIGGLIGMHFRVKGFMTPGEGAWPQESGEQEAGTNA